MTVQEVLDKAINDLTSDTEEGLMAAEAGFNFLLNANRDHPDLLFYAASCLMKRGFNALAYHLLKIVTEKDPGAIAAWNNLGFIEKERNNDEDAIRYFEEAIRLSEESGVSKKDLSDLYSNLGSMYVNYNEPDKAIKYLSKALDIMPNDATARWNRSMAYLEKGYWSKGWEEYAAGFELKDKRKYKDYNGIPEWDGSPGKTVIVYGEQGMGDEIMFSSMIPDLMKDANVIYDAHPRLYEIMRRSFGCTVYGTRKDKDPAWLDWEKADARISIGSLGKFYRNKDGDFPRKPYYLHADPEIVRRYRTDNKRLKIGLSWKGGYKTTRKDLRSVKLDQLMPILELDADFYSLQYTDGAQKEIKDFTDKTGIVIHHDQEMIDDYDLTSGFIQNLDLVITVCTSMAHLCGATGTPCWVMVPEKPAWRYGLKGVHMPWYGDRLIMYRQNGSWDNVVKQIRSDLCKQYLKTIAA